MSLTSGQKTVLVVSGLLAAIALAAWYLRTAQVADAYAAAAADCTAGRGDAALRALDQLHGEDARPRALRVSLALCALDGSVDRYKTATEALGVIQP